jgi:branched-chain amino acid transport system substrate-binding protein
MNASRIRLFAAAIGVAAAVSAPSLLAQEVVKIGFGSPLTGGQANYGKDNQNGTQMAIDELNAQGVKIGGKTIKFELMAEDDQADPKMGPLVAQKFVDAKVNGVVAHFNSGVTIPASSVYAGMDSTVSTNVKYTQQATRPRSVDGDDGKQGRRSRLRGEDAEVEASRRDRRRHRAGEDSPTSSRRRSRLRAER